MYKTNKKRNNINKKTKKNYNKSIKKGGNVNEIKTCKNTFIKKIQKERMDSIKDLQKNLENQARDKYKNNKEKLNEVLKNIKNFTSIPDKKLLKIQNENDINTFCNPGCKDTILEPGDKLPKKIHETYKDNKALLDFFEMRRKEIFGKKTDVLKENFYGKASKKYVEEIKKDGAISLCSPIK
jgi:hypothetical protein